MSRSSQSNDRTVCGSVAPSSDNHAGVWVVTASSSQHSPDHMTYACMMSVRRCSLWQSCISPVDVAHVP